MSLPALIGQEEPVQLASPELVREALARRDWMRSRARRDPAAFNAYVIKDEETGRPITPSAIHLEWHRLASLHRRLLLWAHIEAGKTTQMSIGRVLWEVGNDPTQRVVVVSNTDGQAQKICMTIAKYIEASPEVREVFPDLRRAPGMPWTMHQLFIKRPTKAKDATVQTCGIHGNILGARIDLLILDDLLDYENTVSPAQREDLWNWYHSTLEGRLTRKSRILCIGTAWHREDFMHRVSKNPAWMAVRYPVLDDHGAPTWPDRWPLARIEEKKSVLPPLEFSRQLLCVARSDEDARFKRAWVDACMLRGQGKNPAFGLAQVPQGFATYTGVDLSVGNKGSDLSCLFTIAVHPNGDREVLCIESGRWAGPEIVERIIDTHKRFHSIVVVESNATQEFILQFTRKMSAVPVKPYYTGAKVFRDPHFGIESLATELANEKWIIPSRDGRAHPEIEAWVSELLFYDPRAHPGDRLMASWFAREGARMSMPKAQFGRMDLTRR